MKIGHSDLLAFLATMLGIVLGASIVQAQTVSPEQAAKIVASPDRSDADRVNDRRRKPEEMLVFIAIRPGITALDLSAGGGYTTELLARTIGPSGAVYGQSRPRAHCRAPRAVPPPHDPRLHVCRRRGLHQSLRAMARSQPLRKPERLGLPGVVELGSIVDSSSGDRTLTPSALA